MKTEKLKTMIADMEKEIESLKSRLKFKCCANCDHLEKTISDLYICERLDGMGLDLRACVINENDRGMLPKWCPDEMEEQSRVGSNKKKKGNREQ